MNGGYLLDTNVPSETIRPRPDSAVLSWLNSQPENLQFLSVVTIGELHRGIILLAPGARRTMLESFVRVKIPLWFYERVLPVTQSVAERWGVLDGQRQAAGLPLSVADGLIAATALEYGLRLVTRNVRDFTHLGVQVINPWGNEVAT